MITQIITINTNELNARVMIEKYSNNEFTVQIDTKKVEDKFYNGFLLHRDRNGAVIFSSEKEALSYMLDSFFKNQIIISIDNESSKLLSTAQIKELTKTLEG